MKLRYEVQPNRCNCHPETCSCPDYEVWTKDKDGNYIRRICGGQDKNTLELLCSRANKGMKRG